MIYRLAYDGETGMMGKKGKFKDFDSDHPKIKLFWEINDMQLRHSYELNEKSDSCSPSPSIIAPSVCIPGMQIFTLSSSEFYYILISLVETATYVGSNTTQFNNQEIITDTWMYTQKKEEYYTVYATVTRNDLCIPVMTKMIVFGDGKQII